MEKDEVVKSQIETLKQRLESGENPETVICEVLDDSAYDIENPTMKSFLREHRDVLLEIKNKNSKNLKDQKDEIAQ